MANTPLQNVINKLAGGRRSRLAEMLGIHRSTISGWDNPERRSDGMVGTIPDRYIAKIRQIAEERGVEINIGDLFPSQGMD